MSLDPIDAKILEIMRLSLVINSGTHLAVWTELHGHVSKLHIMVASGKETKEENPKRNFSDFIYKADQQISYLPPSSANKYRNRELTEAGLDEIIRNFRDILHAESGDAYESAQAFAAAPIETTSI